MEFGLRIPPLPQVVATTTPKPTRLIRRLLEAEKDPQGGVVVTRGSTFENAANLDPRFLARLHKTYGNSRLARQELYAELLEDTVGALWKRAQLDALRVNERPPLARIVIGVDPSVSDGEDSAETGIIVAGIGLDGHGYVLEDASLRGTPMQWAREVAKLQIVYQADRIVAETNQGGLMVETTLRTVSPYLPYRGVHASRNKQARAEPVSALYESGMIHHVGNFPDLEDSLTTWQPGGPSPDRMDALVWGFFDLFALDEPMNDPMMGLVLSRGVKGW